MNNPKKIYALMIDGAGRFDVYEYLTVTRQVIHHPKASGRWSQLQLPAPHAPLKSVHLVLSDGSYPIGLHAAEIAAAAAGRPEVLRFVRERDANGDLLCPHCGRPMRTAVALSDHLRIQHNDSGASVAAWWADSPFAVWSDPDVTNAREAA